MEDLVYNGRCYSLGNLSYTRKSGRIDLSHTIYSVTRGNDLLRHTMICRIGVTMHDVIISVTMTYIGLGPLHHRHEHDVLICHRRNHDVHVICNHDAHGYSLHHKEDHAVLIPWHLST